MIRRSSFVVACCLLARIAAADPFTDAFGGVVGAMQARHDALLADSPDKTDKHAARVLTDAIAKLDTPGPSLTVELKHAAVAFKGLEKTFPGDFATRDAVSFGSLIALALPLLDDVVEVQYAGLANDLGGVGNPKAFARADAGRQKARADLDLVASTQPASAALLLLAKSAKLIATAHAVVAKAGSGGGTGGSDVMTATIDDGPFSASTFSADVVQSAGVLDVIGTHDDPRAPSFRRIELVSNGAPINGKGTYSVQGTYDVGANGRDYDHHISLDGSLTVTTYDLAAKEVAGDFSFTTNELNSADAIHVTGGHFDVKHVRVQ